MENQTAILKSLVNSALEYHKRLVWKGTMWDYEIQEFTYVEFQHKVMTLRIKAGVKKVLIFKESHHSNETEKEEEAELKLWERAVQFIINYGLAEMYSDTVKRHRRLNENQGTYVNIPENPLTPEECKTNTN